MHGYLSTPKGLTKRNVATSMQIECFPTTRKWFKVPPQKNEISGFAKIWLKSFKWSKNGRFRMNEFISKPIYNQSYIYAPGPATPPSPPPPWDGSHILAPYEIFPLPPLWCGGGVALSPSPPCGVVGVWYCMLGMYGVYGRSGMACLESMVCLVCMVGMVCMA